MKRTPHEQTKSLLKRSRARVRKLEEEAQTALTVLKHKDEEAEKSLGALKTSCADLLTSQMELENAKKVCLQSEERRHELVLQKSRDDSLISQLRYELTQADAMCGRMTRNLAEVATSVTIRT